jgi:hypothetical protein
MTLTCKTHPHKKIHGIFRPESANTGPTPRLTCIDLDVQPFRLAFTLLLLRFAVFRDYNIDVHRLHVTDQAKIRTESVERGHVVTSI